MRLFLIAAFAATAVAQLTVVDPNLQTANVTSGLPGIRHQFGVESTGTVYVGEEVLGGWTQTPLHRVDPGGAVTTSYITGWPRSVGQMLRNPADGQVYVVNYWQGALEHNHIVRIEPSGTWTVLHDALWGVGHGMALDAAGDFYLGVSGTFNPRQIYQVPAASLGTFTQNSWAPGPGTNAWLAGEAGGGMLCADADTIWRVRPGLPDVAVYTNPAVPVGTTYEWRGLIANPMGAGHLFSRVTATAASTVTAEVVWFGDGPPRTLLSATVPAPGDFSINEDESGGFLVCTQGTLIRVSLTNPLPTPPGTLTAPTTWPASSPITVTLTGRPFTLAPFLLAVDLPLGPPQFPQSVLPVPPYGVVHTSLGLQSSFLAVRDGLGVFGPADPQARLDAGGVFAEIYGVPSTLAGTTLVLQAYVADPQAPNGLFFTTPPVLTTFQ